MGLDFDGSFNFTALNDRLAEAIPAAAVKGGDLILERAEPRVPLLVDLKRANQKRRTDPGELRRSGYVQRSGNDAEIGYTAYWARWQHERLDYSHDVGEPKFLENTLLRDGDDALKVAAEYLQQELGS